MGPSSTICWRAGRLELLRDPGACVGEALPLFGLEALLSSRGVKSLAFGYALHRGQESRGFIGLEQKIELKYQRGVLLCFQRHSLRS